VVNIIKEIKANYSLSITLTGVWGEKPPTAFEE